MVHWIFFLGVFTWLELFWKDFFKLKVKRHKRIIKYFVLKVCFWGFSWQSGKYNFLATVLRVSLWAKALFFVFRFKLLLFLCCFAEDCWAELRMLHSQVIISVGCLLKIKVRSLFDAKTRVTKWHILGWGWASVCFRG